MKQKIVIEVMPCDKCRTKAFQIAAAADGVNSVGFEGKEKEQVVVIGDGVDAADLTSSIRKKAGYANLLGVQELKDKAASDKKNGDDKPKQPTPCMPPPCHCPHPEVYQAVYDQNLSCAIM